jgi:hypothetical protein
MFCTVIEKACHSTSFHYRIIFLSMPNLASCLVLRSFTAHDDYALNVSAADSSKYGIRTPTGRSGKHPSTAFTKQAKVMQKKVTFICKESMYVLVSSVIICN